MRKKRLPPEQRREAILMAAIELAALYGYQELTRDGIALHAGVSMGLVTRYFPTMQQLRRDVMRHAVKREILPIVACGLAIRDPHALRASEDLRRRAAASICDS